jgi:beta-N-acetylhexosaminidase
MRISFRKAFCFLVVTGLVLVSTLSQAIAGVSAQIDASLSIPEIQLDSLTPQEKVGQLFLITFNGSDTSAAAPIFDLIADYHISGVILDRDNQNFVNINQIPEDCWALINNLQQIEFNSSRLSDSSDPGSGNQTDEYIPLFIGISQEGDRSSYTEIINGLSQIPSQLSMGATWDPALAELIGDQVGKELSSLGINLLLGPSLDVLSNPSPGQNDLGVRSFGGDPYWVGKFGQAYIKGIHSGSLNNIAVVGKYFPGLGGSDRLPETEVATVRKSLEQLKQTDLAPFFAVTGNAPSRDQAVDALLNSHIRYQGLQGNIRSTTRPISLDPQAFELLMSLEPLGSWRDEGGLIISDNLGSQALRQLYDPTGASFNLSRVALDAFIAGNDILFLGNLGADNKPIPNHEIEATLDFFAQKYTEDQDFANKVDASVLRILSLKNTLYPSFSISTVLTPEDALSTLGKSTAAEIVSRQSATLINPSITDLDTVIQDPPGFSDRLVILTDTETISLCAGCSPFPTLSTRSLEDAIISLYGPLASRQISRANFNSYSFKDLTVLLDFPSKTEKMVFDIRYASWIIVAIADASSDRPNSDALIRLLSERQDLIRNKRIIVFALGAPYYLDATNISKISAYFGLYSKIPSSLDVAARIIFKEFPNLPGKLSVSLPGINYDLISATSPDPNQIFTIHIGQKADPSSTQMPDSSTPVPPVYRVDDLLDLYTGLILDYNRNPVPDGTPVTFYITVQGVSTALPQVVTIDGSATTSYLIQEANNFTIHAESSSAKSSPIEISILRENETTSEDKVQVTPSLEPVVETGLPDDQTDTNPLPDEDQDSTAPSWRVWLISLLIIFTLAIAAYWVGAFTGQVRWGIKWAISCLIGGLFVYNYLFMGLPGVDYLYPNGVTDLVVSLFVLGGCLAGWAGSFVYQQVAKS